MTGATPEQDKSPGQDNQASKVESSINSAPTMRPATSAAVDLTALTDLDVPGVPISSKPGIQIDDQERVTIRDILSVKRAVAELNIGPHSKVLISVPAGNNNRFRNSPASIILAHAILNNTPAKEVKLRCRIDDKEMREEGLPMDKPDQYSEFQEFYSFTMKQGHSRLAIDPFVQPQNTSQYEAKLAIREAIDGGYSHLILPTHAEVLGKRLLLASQSEERRHETESVPAGLRVSILNHGSDESMRVGSLERSSLLLAEVAERYFPDFMDKMALKEGLPGKLYGWAQAAKVSLLKRGI